MKSGVGNLPDIKPQTEIRSLDRGKYQTVETLFPIDRVAPLVGFQTTFIRKVCGRKSALTVSDVISLLDQDAFRETFVPRSKIIEHLLTEEPQVKTRGVLGSKRSVLLHDDVLHGLRELPSGSVQCVVTSTPYWALRVYKESFNANWSDGEICPFGHEQTPEGFLRHTTEVLSLLQRVLSDTGSIWWNIMDSFNTCTQIRGNAVEALRAMRGEDRRRWSEHECRRYSAGHAYLKDGEQCMIPALIAERASRMGFYVKSVITWAKTSTLPEPQESRVSRNLEYVLHLTKTRTPFFQKDSYRTLPNAMGGRNAPSETDKLSDVWVLPTSAGRDGHGAQFPIPLPARCIALSTQKDDVVLDPFVGAGNSGIAAMALGRKFIGIDVCKEYLDTARERIRRAHPVNLDSVTMKNSEREWQDSLL